MIEDELLKLRFKLGSEDALRCIYEKYLNYMLTVAMAFLNDAHAAEDVVHDVFVSLAQNRARFGLHGSLKSYLATCVANRARDRLRARKRRSEGPDVELEPEPETDPPEDTLICTEQLRRINKGLSQLSYEQREVITMRLKAGMKFRQIAQFQGVSLNAAQARYRRGIDKLRSILDGRPNDETDRENRTCDQKNRL